MASLIAVVALTLLVSCACSVAEAALYSVPVSHIEALERRGRPAGRILTALRSRIDRPIAAILSLNTIANTGGAVLAGALASVALGAQWIGVFSAGLTIALLIVGEVLPKTIGVVYARPVAALIARPLSLLVVVLSPLVWLTRVLTRVVLPGPHEQQVSDEDLLVLVRLGVRSGAFQSHEAAVIENVLALEARRAGDILTPRSVVFTLPASMTVGAAAAQEQIRTYSRVPVYGTDRDDMVGVVHRIDILTALADGRPDVRLEELRRPLEVVAETMPLDQLLRLFLDRREHLVAVIDEFGSLTGVVSLEDVLEELIGKEIVGEQDRVADLREWARRRAAPARRGSDPLPRDPENRKR